MSGWSVPIYESNERSNWPRRLARLDRRGFSAGAPSPTELDMTVTLLAQLMLAQFEIVTPSQAAGVRPHGLLDPPDYDFDAGEPDGGEPTTNDGGESGDWIEQIGLSSSSADGGALQQRRAAAAARGSDPSGSGGNAGPASGVGGATTCRASHRRSAAGRWRSATAILKYDRLERKR
jgi:hypothetical protein